MIQKLGIEETEASQMNGVLYKSYGTSMAGLKVGRPWKKKNEIILTNLLPKSNRFTDVLRFLSSF
jgi:hypothetical protein